MQIFNNFTEACTRLLKEGYDRSDSQQTAHLQDLYAKMKPSQVKTLMSDPANYTVLAWVMGGQEVARVAAEIATADQAATVDSLRTAAALANTSTELLTAELKQERADAARLTEALEAETAARKEAENVAKALQWSLDQAVLNVGNLSELYDQATDDLTQAQTEARHHRREAERLTAERLELGEATTDAQDETEGLRTKYNIASRRLESEKNRHDSTRAALHKAQEHAARLAKEAEQARAEAAQAKTLVNALTIYAQILEA